MKKITRQSNAIHAHFIDSISTGTKVGRIGSEACPRNELWYTSAGEEVLKPKNKDFAFKLLTS